MHARLRSVAFSSLFVAFIATSSTASAHAIEHQRATRSHGTPSIAADGPPVVERARGSLSYELLGGGIGLTLSSAATYMAMSQPDDADDLLGRGVTLVAGFVPLATALGVHLGGERTRGNGRFMSAWGGAMLGMLGGALLSVPIAPEGSPDNERIAAMVPCAALGMITGSLLLYRATARLPAASVTPTLDGRGATFTLNGVL